MTLLSQFLQRKERLLEAAAAETSLAWRIYKTAAAAAHVTQARVAAAAAVIASKSQICKGCQKRQQD